MATVSVYLIFGEDEYLVSSKAKEIVSRLVPDEERSLGLDVVNGKSGNIEEATRAIAQCVEALQTLGFFGNKKVVWLQDVTFLTDNNVGKSERVKSGVNGLADMIKKGLSPDQILIVTSPKVDKRYAFYKACAAKGELHEYSISEKAYLVEKQALERLQEILSRAGLNMRQDVQEAFLERVGTDTRQVVNEIEKLGVYVGDRKDIQIHDLEAVTTSTRGALAWDLADAAGKRDLPRALGILRQLLFQNKNESAIGLIITLETRVRELMIYRQALENRWLVTKSGYGGKSGVAWGEVPPDVERMLSGEFSRDPRTIHPFRIGLLAQQAKKFTLSELKYAHRAILEAYENIVSSTIPDPMALELLLIRILRKKPARA